MSGIALVASIITLGVSIASIALPDAPAPTSQTPQGETSDKPSSDTAAGSTEAKPAEQPEANETPGEGDTGGWHVKVTKTETADDGDGSKLLAPVFPGFLGQVPPVGRVGLRVGVQNERGSVHAVCPCRRQVDCAGGFVCAAFRACERDDHVRGSFRSVGMSVGRFCGIGVRRYPGVAEWNTLVEAGSGHAAVDGHQLTARSRRGFAERGICFPPAP